MTRAWLQLAAATAASLTLLALGRHLNRTNPQAAA